jgi:hypothetical protein
MKLIDDIVRIGRRRFFERTPPDDLMSEPSDPEPVPDESRWQLKHKSDDGRTEIYHLDGLAWHDAPLPLTVHTCRPQTRAWMNWFIFVERCACGAIRYDRRRWENKNERRDSGEEA